MRIIEILPFARCRRQVQCSDDQELTGGLLVRGLWKTGHRAEGAGNGRAAQARLPGPPDEFDAMVNTHAMSGLNGRGLVRELRLPAFRGRVIAPMSLVANERPAAHHLSGVAAILQELLAMPAIVRQLGTYA